MKVYLKVPHNDSFFRDYRNRISALVLNDNFSLNNKISFLWKKKKHNRPQDSFLYRHNSLKFSRCKTISHIHKPQLFTVVASSLCVRFSYRRISTLKLRLVSYTRRRQKEPSGMTGNGRGSGGKTSRGMETAQCVGTLRWGRLRRALRNTRRVKLWKRHWEQYISLAGRARLSRQGIIQEGRREVWEEIPSTPFTPI